jgi:hypothetical protein
MTEADWNSCDDPGPMLKFLRDTGRASERKLRLFVVGCCCRVSGWSANERGRRAVELAESVADGLASQEEAERAATAALCSYLVAADMPACSKASAAAAFAYATQKVGTLPALSDAAMFTLSPAWNAALTEERAAQAHVLRDLFGSVTLVRMWNDGTVRRLAEAVYAERRLSGGHLDSARLAVLADALEEGGVTEAELLGHLRSAGPHYRGCWAVDALLGKS